MSAGIRAVTWTIAIVLVIVALFALGIRASQPAEATDIRTDVVVCADIDTLGLTQSLENLLRLQTGECLEVLVPVVEVTTRVEVPGDTITRLLPQPTRTVTVPVPGDTRTVYVDRNAPGQTKTVTVAPRPQRSTAPEPTSGSTVAPTNTATATATATKSAEPETTTKTVEKPGKVRTVLKNVSIGLASILGLILLMIAAMGTGYGMGFKDSEAKETRFMSSLLGRKDKP